MEVTRLILVLQILGSAWSIGQSHNSKNDFVSIPWSSSAYRPRSIPDAFLDKTAISRKMPEATSEQMLDLVVDKLVKREEAKPTENPLNEMEVVSALLRYSQHHRDVLKNVLRGLKLLRDSNMSDIRRCVHEALSKQPSPSHDSIPSTILGHNEEKYIVKALLTQPNYMEFCAERAARRTMRKEVYDSLVTGISSILKNRQMKLLTTTPYPESATTLTAETDQPTTPPVVPAEATEAATTTVSPSAKTDEPTSSTSANLVGNSEEVVFPSSEDTETREDMNIALNEEVLTSGYSSQITEPDQKAYPTVKHNVIRSKLPLIYHHGNIYVSPGRGYVPHPYLSVFSVGEIDPEVMTRNVIPLPHPGFYRTYTTKEFPFSTTEISPSNTIIEDNEDSTLQVSEVSPRGESFRSVKKMLTDDEFKWPGPFAMERIRVERSPTQFSLDLQNSQDQQETGEIKLSAESNRAPKEYSLPDMMESEAVPVISVPGEIPDVGKEINVIKEFVYPVPTAEPPIVLKVQRVPTHVDTSEFWNAGYSDQVADSSTNSSFQNREEANIHTFLDSFNTTESSEMRESKTFKEEEIIDNLDKHSQQIGSSTEKLLQTTTTIQDEIKMHIAEVLFGKDARDSSEESDSNESVLSSEEEEADNTSSEFFVQTTARDTVASTTEQLAQTDTQVTNETSIADEETTASDVEVHTTDAQMENSARTTNEVTTRYTTDETAKKRDDTYETEGSVTASAHTTPEASTIPIEAEAAESTTLSDAAKDITEKIAEHTTTETASAHTTPEASTIPIEAEAAESTTLSDAAKDITEKIAEHTTTETISSQGSKLSASHQDTRWNPDFDFVVEEFSSSHIAKDEFPDEYMDYSLSLLGELAKSVIEHSARSTVSKPGTSARSQMVNETQTTSPAEGDSTESNKDSQTKAKGFQQSPASTRSRRQAKKYRELPSAVLKLFKDKSLDPEAVPQRLGTSANANLIPSTPDKFPKLRSQKMLFSLSEKKRKVLEDDEDGENQTDSDNSVHKDASIMELINLKRVSRILEVKDDKA